MGFCRELWGYYLNNFKFIMYLRSLVRVKFDIVRNFFQRMFLKYYSIFLFCFNYYFFFKVDFVF